MENCRREKEAAAKMKMVIVIIMLPFDYNELRCQIVIGYTEFRY